VFGDDDFVERVVGEKGDTSGKITIEDILAGILCRYPVSRDDLSRPGKGRALSWVRAMAAWIAQDVPSVTLRDLAEKTGRDVSSLSAAAQRMQKRSAAAPGLQGTARRNTKCKA
jgi:chromosomal replication initiation ATPase DnaA